MHEDWRQERDRALLTLETAKRPRDRVLAASMIVDLALEDATRRPELAAELPRLLGDPQERVRRMAVALAALVLPPEEAEAFFAARLQDAGSEVRMEAMGQLADLARPSARGILAAGLQDPVFAVRFEAARGMAALHHPAGLEVLVEALDDHHLRFRALGALAELGDPRALPGIRKVHARILLPGFERTQAAGAMARLGDPDGERWLLQRVARRWGQDRALAVELLGELKAGEAQRRLEAILADRRDACRGAAARGLGRLGDPAALGALAAVLEDPSAPDDLRLDAAEGLCLLQDPAARARVEACAAGAPAPLQAELRSILEEYS